MVWREKRRERVGDEGLVGALAVHEAGGENAHRPGASLGVVLAGHTIHGKSQLDAVAHECGDALRQRHCERSTDAYAPIATHDRCPGARPHEPILLDYAALE